MSWNIIELLYKSNIALVIVDFIMDIPTASSLVATPGGISITNPTLTHAILLKHLICDANTLGKRFDLSVSNSVSTYFFGCRPLSGLREMYC